MPTRSQLALREFALDPKSSSTNSALTTHWSLKPSSGPRLSNANRARPERFTSADYAKRRPGTGRTQNNVGARGRDNRLPETGLERVLMMPGRGPTTGQTARRSRAPVSELG